VTNTPDVADKSESLLLEITLQYFLKM